MAIKADAKRAKAGQSLADYETQAINAVNQLKSIKVQVVALKTSIQNDADYDAADEAEVQAMITAVLAAIASI